MTEADARLGGECPAATTGSRERAGSVIRFALTGLGAFLVSLDVSIANSLLPAIGMDFGDNSRAHLSWVITAYAIAFAAALVPGGRLADRIGRRRVFHLGLIVFGVGSVLCGVAPTLPVLVFGRVIQGVGAAAASPASLGLLLNGAGDYQRSVLAARWGGMGAVGIGLGPIVGGALTSALSWRIAFLINLPFAILAVLAGPHYLAETNRHPGRRLPDPLGAGIFATSAALATFALSQSSAWSAWDPRVLLSAAAAVLLAWWFVQRCLRVDEPLLDLSALRSTHVAAITAVTVLYACGFFGILFSFVLFLTGRWHLTLVEVGAALLPMTGAALVLTTSVGRLANRTGFRLPLTVGLTLMTIGALLNVAYDSGHVFQGRFLVFGVITGIGIGLCYPLLGAAAVAGLDAAHLAAVTALNQCARQLGAAIGVAAAVSVLGNALPAPLVRFQASWMLCAAFCFLAAAVALLIRPLSTMERPA